MPRLFGIVGHIHAEHLIAGHYVRRPQRLVVRDKGHRDGPFDFNHHIVADGHGEIIFFHVADRFRFKRQSGASRKYASFREFISRLRSDIFDIYFFACDSAGLAERVGAVLLRTRFDGRLLCQTDGEIGFSEAGEHQIRAVGEHRPLKIEIGDKRSATVFFEIQPALRLGLADDDDEVHHIQLNSRVVRKRIGNGTNGSFTRRPAGNLGGVFGKIKRKQRKSAV